MKYQILQLKAKQRSIIYDNLTLSQAIQELAAMCWVIGGRWIGPRSVVLLDGIILTIENSNRFNR